eukprot:CAMPEP_0196763062 /NCGR_PEP_ID=MMETSP1095-20130614/3325_1 /TAXON_ID=96789 ORGANISM="Chromulina nebulosa, Strain UTEXLB2642" /NCGR_SAMPLE_ID=MMETSP1095 /ASSEMBLY_ACC=CAM_ASM_000446 /LENGTH=206 /DNA_ID=CAMNT_0042115435 /DNA_START=305 /DNA_END=925 /DNA_ORIENTATION=-
MPTWSEDELRCVCSNNENIIWYDNFVTFGGVPRHVLWDGLDEDPRMLLNRALKSKGRQLAESLYAFGHAHGDIDLYMLIHINPCWNNTTKEWMYNGVQVYSFASDEIFKLMLKYYEKSLLAQAIRLFDEGSRFASNMLGSASAGNFFEKVCLWLVPIAEKPITVSFFDKSESLVFQLPKMSYLPSDWKDSAKLKENILYQPRICNL